MVSAHIDDSEQSDATKSSGEGLGTDEGYEKGKPGAWNEKGVAHAHLVMLKEFFLDNGFTV